MHLGHIRRLTRRPCSDVIPPCLARRTSRLSRLFCCTYVKKCVAVFSRFDKDWTLKDWVDELIPGCSLHHFNLSGIDISLLNNKASKQVLPVHSTWTANPLEVSNLRFKCCARVRGENRYHIWTPRGCQTKQATVLSDKYEPRSPLWLPALPLMRRAGPSAPCKKGICDAEKTHLVRNKKSNLHQWLTRFQVATERLQELVHNK